MRKTLFMVCLLLLCLASTGLAADYKLNNGQTVSGELVESGSNDANALISIGDSKYERVKWEHFSQDDLKGFLEKFSGSKKIVEAIEPYIEVSIDDRVKKTDVTIKPLSSVVAELQKERLAPKNSVISSMFGSAPGIFLLLLIVGANIFAGYEIAIFRAQPTGLVAGLAAIPGVGFITNIVFLAMPMRVEKKSEQDIAYEANEISAPTFVVPGQDVVHQEEAAAAAAAVASGHSASAPKPEVFSRGQFTFNKRFFETKFPGFFGIVRREEDKAKLLVFKTTKGEFNALRISRITAGEIYIQADRGGGATVEEAIHFGEIQEVTLRHLA